MLYMKLGEKKCAHLCSKCSLKKLPRREQMCTKFKLRRTDAGGARRSDLAGRLAAGKATPHWIGRI